jgi:hypothetical protein
MVLKLYYGMESYDRMVKGDDSWKQEVWEHEGDPIAECETTEDCLQEADLNGLGVYFVYDNNNCVGAVLSIHAQRFSERVTYYPYEE